MTIGERRQRVTSEFYRCSEASKQKTIEYTDMIAQQRLPIHMEYLQPHITSSETKASPLALLAATCSSIGKSDTDKKDIKTTSTILNTLTSTSEEEHKSSFKPYKIDVKPTSLRSSPPALRINASPPSSKLLSASHAMHSKVHTTVSMSESERRTRFYAEGMNRDSTDYYSLPIKCHTSSPPLPHLPPKVSMLPSQHDHSDCVHCKKMRPHTEHLPVMGRHSQGAPCSCPTCNQARMETNCHYPPPLPSFYPSAAGYKTSHLQPMITCRDPNCTNCSKVPPPHSSIQNFLHPALIHQCTHGGAPHKSFPPPPPISTTSSYDSYLKASPNSKPYVCNWVSDGKHCGNGFPTSEELFQHLRSHTNLQQHKCETHSTMPLTASSTQLQPPTNSCTVHGCPCGQRKPSPRPTIPGYSYGPSSNSIRYTPYSRAGHGYAPPPHSVFHY